MYKKIVYLYMLGLAFSGMLEIENKLLSIKTIGYIDIAMIVPVTLKLPAKLKARLAQAARQSHRTTQQLMLDAIWREVAINDERRRFIRAALVADQAIDSGAAVYAAGDVHAWLEQLALGRSGQRPKPVPK